MAEENGSLSPESEAGNEEDNLQRLKKDARDLRENLRLRRSRNVGPEGKFCLTISSNVTVALSFASFSLCHASKGGGCPCH